MVQPLSKRTFCKTLTFTDFNKTVVHQESLVVSQVPITDRNYQLTLLTNTVDRQLTTSF